MEKIVTINDQALLIDWYKTAFLERYLAKEESKALDFKKILDIGACLLYTSDAADE